MAASKYPKTRIDPVTDVVHGRKLTDTYRWLEDSDSPEVLQWSQAQNDFTARTLKAQTDIPALRREVASYAKIDTFGAPFFRAGWYFWGERKADQNQPAIYRQKGLDGRPEVLFDPNGRTADDTVSIATWSVSPNAKFLLYALSEKGTEMATIYVRDLTTGQDLPDAIAHSMFPEVVWIDDQEFVYTRNPEPGTVPPEDERYYTHLYRHRLGRDPRQDPKLFGEGRHKEDFIGLSIDETRRYLTLKVGRDWSQNEVYLIDLTNNQVQPVVQKTPALFEPEVFKGYVYLWTDWRAEFGQVLRAPLDDLPQLEDWEEVIPERAYKLENIKFTSELLLAEYLENAHSKVEIMDHNGKSQGLLKLPPFSSLASLAPQKNQADFFYSFVGFTTPLEVWRYDAKTQTESLYRRAKLAAGAQDLAVKQEWFTSRDGTKVPMFIVHQPGLKLDGRNPALLWGYGGFDISETPFYPRGFMPLLARGGVLAVANIRGGGEFGRAWHEAAMKDRKQNSFDDFIAAAEHLVSQGYTAKSKLAIMGGSNGGLLVAACAVQRPDLFKAVICAVPLLDMVRFPKFLIASRWTSEYGDPADKRAFEYIIKWSPYHNVKPGTEYPAILFETADHDSRVEPLHARKMAALMQATNKINPILLRTEIDSGHGAGTPLSKYIDSQADTLGFLFWQLAVPANNEKSPLS